MRYLLTSFFVFVCSPLSAMALKEFPTTDNYGLFYMSREAVEKTDVTGPIDDMRVPTQDFSMSDSQKAEAFEDAVLIAVSGGIIPDHRSKKFQETLFNKYSSQSDQIKTNEMTKNFLSGGMLSLVTGTSLSRLALLLGSVGGFSGTYEELKGIAIRDVARVFNVILHQPFDSLNDSITHAANVAYSSVGFLITGSFYAGLGAFVLAYVGEQLSASDFDRLTLVEHFTIAVEKIPVKIGRAAQDAQNFEQAYKKVMTSAYQKCVEKLISSYPNEKAVAYLIENGFCNPVQTSVESLEELTKKDKTIRRYIEQRQTGRGSFYQEVRALSPGSLLQFILPGFNYTKRLKSRLRFANAKDVSPSIALWNWMGTDSTAFTKYLKAAYTKVALHKFDSLNTLFDASDTPQKIKRPQNKLRKRLFTRNR